MPFIEVIQPGKAAGALQRIYDAAKQRAGSVANIIKIMSLDPRSTQGSMQFYISLMKTDNALSGARKEMLGTVVSNINDCYY